MYTKNIRTETTTAINMLSCCNDEGFPSERTVGGGIAGTGATALCGVCVVEVVVVEILCLRLFKLSD